MLGSTSVADVVEGRGGSLGGRGDGMYGCGVGKSYLCGLYTLF